MDRFEKFDATLQMQALDGQNVAVFAPSASAMGHLCVSLSLLWHQLATRLLLECGEQRLTIAVDERLVPSVAALGVWSPPTIRLTLSRTELERWLVFALKYCRDGTGEVDHIDLDARHSPNGVVVASIVFKVPLANAPMSPEELRQLLAMK